VSQSVVAGGSVTLSVAASGHPLPFSYRWRKGGSGLTNIVLADTKCFFTITNVQPNPGTNTVTYTVAVTNLAGAASLSSNVVLTVLADTDADGLPDEWELAHGFSVTAASDALLDSDGDEATNAQEYMAGTDPRDPQDYLRLEYGSAHDSNVWLVRFFAVSNRTYTLQARGGFSLGGVWAPAGDVVAAPTNRIIEMISEAGNSTNHRFFRLVTPRSH